MEWTYFMVAGRFPANLTNSESPPNNTVVSWKNELTFFIYEILKLHKTVFTVFENGWMSRFLETSSRLQRSIETYDMRNFPQHVLLCTRTVHDQSANICIKDPLNTKHKIFQNRLNFLMLCCMFKLGVFVKLNPWIYY